MRFLPTPPALNVSVSGGLRQNIAMTFGTEKLKCFGYPTVKKVEDILTRFDRMYERNRQKDGQTNERTPHDSIGRAYA